VYIIADLGYNKSNIEKGLPMPINVDLLIAAPVLQDFIIDKDGTPMAGGTITCYQDNSRTTLKNWYYQSGTPGNYTYIRLPNPLTLSAAGTICDINGVDTIPFFYPYSELDDNVVEPYYITIVNYAQTNQITRANFPFLPPAGAHPTTTSAFDNYIINNEFWRNIGTLNLTNSLFATVCPSQHDGFLNPDIFFIKNITGGLDTVTFTKFPLTTTPILTGDITPEFYLNHTCSNRPTGETQKAYYFPISLHVNTLASVPFTATIQAQNAGGTGTGQNVINLFIYQFTGTGTTPPPAFLIGSITLTTGWEKYEFTSVFPPTAGLTLGSGGDDALYLLVQMPLNMNCSINFCKPSIYLSETVPVNSFQTYDQIDAIINSPRTGDVRTSLNSFSPYGWVPMNDGVIGLNAMSVVPTNTLPGYTRGNSDTWQLFNLLWNLAQPYDSGSNFNPICQMYTNNGTVLTTTNYGASAYADFNANNALALTKMFGKVVMGTVPIASLFQFYAPESQNVTISNSGGNILCTPTSITGFWQGKPIVFQTNGGSLPGNIVVSAIYYVTNITGSTFQVSTSYAASIAGTPVVAYSSNGSNVYVNAHPTGTQTGQYSHVQLTGEVGSHTHTLVNPFQITFDGGNLASGSLTSIVLGSSNSGPIPFTLTGTPLTGANANTPAGSAFNITQPGVFYNIFMKL
jgi:hypothetical protein